MKRALRITNKRIVFLCFVVYVSIAHYILPTYNHGKDYSFFHSWNMFSNGPRKSHRDLSFNNGETFILRDYQHKFNQQKDEIVLLNYIVQISPPKIRKIKSDYKQLFHEKFNHQKLEIFTRDGPLYKHIFYKEKAKILNKEVIYYE